jgi:hypothetical protein
VLFIGPPAHLRSSGNPLLPFITRHDGRGDPKGGRGQGTAPSGAASTGSKMTRPPRRQHACRKFEHADVDLRHESEKIR